MASRDEFDIKVRVPLWYAIYDAFGEKYRDHVTGDSGWGEEYWELEKRLERRLGVWKLSEHEHAGDAISVIHQERDQRRSECGDR